MHQRSLILLHPRVKGKCIYKNIHYFTLTLAFKVIRNVAKCPLHRVTYAPTEFEVTTSKCLGGEAFTRKFNILTFDLGVKVTRNVAQYSLHYVTYSATKFEVATSDRLGVDIFTRKYII